MCYSLWFNVPTMLAASSLEAPLPGYRPSTRLVSKDSFQNAFGVLRIVLLLGPLSANEIPNVCRFLGLLFSWL